MSTCNCPKQDAYANCCYRKKAEERIKQLEQIIANNNEISQLESLIRGHMEAMRPLLEQWSKLK